MRGFEARQIIEDIKKDREVKFIGEDDQEVELNGSFTCEELQAILHKMEYDD